MKLRLTQAGWENYTANFGGVEFVDGLSVGDVTSSEGARLGNIVQCVMEDGTNPSSSQSALDSQCEPMQVRGEQVTRAVVANSRIYTKEELEAIAGDKGIKGLREVSDPLGVKASGIADLIGMIVAAQAKPAEPAVAEVVVEPVPAVPAEVVAKAAV